MKKLFFYTSLIITTILFIGCKKCEIPEGTETGIIITDVILRETKSASSSFDNILIQDEATNQKYEGIDISFDGGLNFSPINFSQYSLMGLRTTTNCSATFDRDVKSNNVNEVVTYTVTINECPTCTNTITTDNWVLIPKVPASYIPLFKINP